MKIYDYKRNFGYLDFINQYKHTEKERDLIKLSMEYHNFSKIYKNKLDISLEFKIILFGLGFKLWLNFEKKSRK